MPLLRNLGWAWLGLLSLVLGVSLAVLSIALAIEFKWTFLVFITLMTFGIVMMLNRGYWGRPSFWAIVVAVGTLHTAGYVALLMRVDKWPGLLWGLVAWGEIVGTNVIVAALITPKNRT